MGDTILGFLAKLSRLKLWNNVLTIITIMSTYVNYVKRQFVMMCVIYIIIVQYICVQYLCNTFIVQ